MVEIRFQPASGPPRNIALLQRLMTLFARSAAMGVLSGGQVTGLNAAALRRLLDALQRARLLRSASIDLAPLLAQDAADLDPATAERMEIEVGKLAGVLDDSPSPATEWATMRELLGDDLLARLVGVAETSLRRYAAGARETPQPVAERLHWLAMVIADLAGAYNAFGIRRWFERPRAQLGGRSPRQLLGEGWHVDDAAAARVRALAAALAGPQPLAA